MSYRFRAFRKDAQVPCVLFVSAKWCGHCKNTAPEVDKAQRILGSKTPVYVVDADRDKAVVEALGVEGFPTILVVSSDRRMTEYQGPRTGAAIAQFAKANA